MDKQVCAPLWNYLNICEWKALCILDLLRDDEGIDAAQRFYLPVNVQHLRLEKAGAVARYNPSAHKQRPVSLGIPDLSIFNWPGYVCRSLYYGQRVFQGTDALPVGG